MYSRTILNTQWWHGPCRKNYLIANLYNRIYHAWIYHDVSRPGPSGWPSSINIHLGRKLMPLPSRSFIKCWSSLVLSDCAETLPACSTYTSKTLLYLYTLYLPFNFANSHFPTSTRFLVLNSLKLHTVSFRRLRETPNFKQGGICRGKRGNFPATGLIPILQHIFFLSPHVSAKLFPPHWFHLQIPPLFQIPCKNQQAIGSTRPSALSIVP